MNNLWNLKDIKNGMKNSPNKILEEQAKYFEKTVDNVLYAKIQNTKLSEAKSSAYKLATNFSIVSPTLDNYTYVLFTVYSNPEKNYPLMVTVNDESENEFNCNDENEFIEVLRQILGSKETAETISVLYSKSKDY